MKDFVAWLESAEAEGAVGSILESYRDHLMRTTDEANADDVMSAIFNVMNDHPHAWPALFDKVYSAPEPEFNISPSALLVDVVSGLEPGGALDIAMGQGRNSIYLAKQGWDVTGIDISPVGVENALASAASMGLSLNAYVTDLQRFDLGNSAWDLIVATYTPMPLMDHSTADRIFDGLRPDGRVVIESFGLENDRPRRPVDLVPELLLESFANFEILRFEDLEEVPDWDPDPQRIIRMVAARP